MRRGDSLSGRRSRVSKTLDRRESTTGSMLRGGVVEFDVKREMPE